MKVLGITEDGKFRVETISEETLEDALNVIRHVYCMHEALSVGVELPDSPQGREELALLSADAVRDGVSLIAVTNDDDRKVVAVMINKIHQQYKPGESFHKTWYMKFHDERCQDPSSKALIKITADLYAKGDLFTRFNTDCIFETVFTATNPEYRRSGIVKLLADSSISLGKFLYYEAPEQIQKCKLSSRYANIQPLNGNPITKSPTVAVGIPTSFITQKVALGLGFEVVAEAFYEDLVYNGKTIASRVGTETKSCKLVGKKWK